MSCGIGRRRGWDPALLWRRLAAVALIQPLFWEPPYAAGRDLKSNTQSRQGRTQKKKKKKKKVQKKKLERVERISQRVRTVCPVEYEESVTEQRKKLL